MQFRNAVQIAFHKNFKNILLKISFFYVLDRFDVLISKIIFKKYIYIYINAFRHENTLKNNRNYTLKQAHNIIRF